MIHDCDKVMYLTNQFKGKKLVLVKGIFYPLIKDIIHFRYFIVNMNNEIIYLDQFNEKAVVKLVSDRRIRLNFFRLKISPQIQNKMYRKSIY